MYLTPSKTPVRRKPRISKLECDIPVEGIDMSALRRAPVKSSRIQQIDEETEEMRLNYLLKKSNPATEEQVEICSNYGI